MKVDRTVAQMDTHLDPKTADWKDACLVQQWGHLMVDWWDECLDDVKERRLVAWMVRRRGISKDSRMAHSSG